MPDIGLERYKNSFARNYHRYYILKYIKEDKWKTINAKLHDNIIKNHLKQKYWAGVCSSWYPLYGLIDIDKPYEGKLERVVETFKLEPCQYMLCTSQSYDIDGSMHLLFKPEYRDKPITMRLYKDILESNRCIQNLNIEIYPQKKKCIRLPFGKDQHHINEGIVCQNTWEEYLYWWEKVEPMDLYCINTKDLNNKKYIKHKSEPVLKEHLSSSQGKELFEEGLQNQGTRNRSTYLVAVYLWRENYLPEIAEEEMKCWIREKHNGMSKEVCKGNWKLIDTEIDNAIHGVYEYYGDNTYPDVVNNKYNEIFLSDILFIGKLFHGDIKMQKRMFNLINYYRQKNHLYPEKVFCSKNNWTEIAGRNDYKCFQRILLKKGILKINDSYKPNCCSKTISLDLPPHINSESLKNDGRAVGDYKTALKIVFPSIKEVMQVMGLKERTAQRYYK